MTKEESTIVQIDIDKIIRQKAGKRAWLVPRCLTRLIERLIHQDFINGYLRQGRVGVDGCPDTCTCPKALGQIAVSWKSARNKSGGSALLGCFLPILICL